jgi:hypothetical protein
VIVTGAPARFASAATSQRTTSNSAHAGGSDSRRNLTSLCAWCHLEGIHRGRLRATGDASHLRWDIGRSPILLIDGREKLEIVLPTEVVAA